MSCKEKKKTTIKLKVGGVKPDIWAACSGTSTLLTVFEMVIENISLLLIQA